MEQDKKVSQPHAIVDKKCEYCQRVTQHELTTTSKDGWITYRFKCKKCGFEENIQYDESRR